MKIAFDFDGVISRQIASSFQFPLWIWKIIVLFARPVAGMSFFRELTTRHEVLVVSSRPESMLFVTKLWLWIHRIKISKVCCLGLLIDKSPLLLEEKVDYFFDDKGRHVMSAKKVGINSFIFTSWEQIKKILRSKGIKIDRGIGSVQRFISSSFVGKFIKSKLKKALKDFSAKSKKLEKLNAELTLLPTCSVGYVKNELVEFKKLNQPIALFHATTKTGLADVLFKGLEVRKTLGQENEKTSVVYFHPDLWFVKAFGLFGKWPLRFLFDFSITEPKDQILKVIVPDGTRIGITSWYEVVSLDPISPENVKLKKPRGGGPS